MLRQHIQTATYRSILTGLVFLNLSLIVSVAVDQPPPAHSAAESRLQQDIITARQLLRQQQAAIDEQRQQQLAILASLRQELTASQQMIATVTAQRDELRQRAQQQDEAGHNLELLQQQLKRLLISEGLLSTDSATLDWNASQVALIDRLNQLAQHQQTGLQTTEVLDRQGRLQETSLWQWGAVQSWAVDAHNDQRGITTVLSSGESMVAGPPLVLPSPASLPNWAPFDVTGRFAQKETVAGGLGGLLQRAGIFAWPILAVAFIGLMVIVDRLSLLWRWRQPQHVLSHILQTAAQHGTVPSSALRRRSPLMRMLARINAGSDDDAASRQQQAGAALVQAEVQLQRGLRLLAVLAAAAPLLGLLGTVTGMITSFEALDVSRGGNAGQLSAGIGEALLTTELGLIVAVPLLLAHAVFARDAQRRRGQSESAALDLLAAYQRHESGLQAPVTPSRQANVS